MTDDVKLSVKWWVYEALRDYKTKVFAVTGGLGSGKTDGMACWLHDRVTINPKSQFFWFFEPTHKKVEDAAIPRYKKHLTRLGYIEGQHYKITGNAPYKLTYLVSGQEVHFHSYDNPGLIVATEIAAAVLDEAGDADIEAFRNIRVRVRCPDAEIRQVFIGGAPQGINWFADTFDSDKNEGWTQHAPRDAILEQKLYRRFTLWTDDNVDNLPDDYIDNLMDVFGDNPNLVQSYRFGVFCPLVEGSAYSNYLPQVHDIDDIEPDRYRDITLCFDFNANPLAWAAIQKVPYSFGQERRFNYTVIHEANEGHSELDSAIIEFATKFPREEFRDTKIRLYGDRTGHAQSHKISGSDFENIRKYLNELGYKNVEICATKSVAPEAASVEAVQRLFLRKILLICKRCRMTRRSALATTWKAGTRKLDKPAGETHTHHMDGIKYWAWQETREQTGKPQQEILGIHY